MLTDNGFSQKLTANTSSLNSTFATLEHNDYVLFLTPELFF